MCWLLTLIHCTENCFSQSHRRQHNKDKPYKCTNCNKGYVDSASLEVHMSTHTVKHARIYSCGLCNRTYTSVRHLSISEEHFYLKTLVSDTWQLLYTVSAPLISGDVSGETHGETQPRPAACTRSTGGAAEPKPGPGQSSEPGRRRRWRIEPTRGTWERRTAGTEPEQLPPVRRHPLSV